MLGKLFREARILDVENDWWNSFHTVPITEKNWESLEWFIFKFFLWKICGFPVHPVSMTGVKKPIRAVLPACTALDEKDRFFFSSTPTF